MVLNVDNDLKVCFYGRPMLNKKTLVRINDTIQGHNHGIDIGGGSKCEPFPRYIFLSAFPTIHNFHILIKICSSRT